MAAVKIRKAPASVPTNGEATRTAGNPLQAKLATARREMAAALVERDAEIDLVLMALVAQEHVLFVGAPGTGKSLLLRTITDQLLGGQPTSSVVLNQHTPPEALFGPVSIAGLKADKYFRRTAGRIPEAVGIFLDEVWKGSPAILNTLLSVLNERTYDEGETSKKCPLRLAVAASNEYPAEGDAAVMLAALFDRFLFRKNVRAVAEGKSAGRDRLLWDDNLQPKLTVKMTLAEIDQAHAEAMALPITPEAVEAVTRIIATVIKEGIIPTDRRLTKVRKAIRAAAYLDGATEVRPEHAEALAHVLWTDPVEQPTKTAGIVAAIANPLGLKVTEFLSAAEEVIGQADPTKTKDIIVASEKLEKIEKDLRALGSDGRCVRAADYVKEQLRKMKVAYDARH